jgi:gliding motility-associated-like protein
MGKVVLFSIFLLLNLPLISFSEGTRQIAPATSDSGQLCIDKLRNDFGFFDAAPDYRINIYIANLSEKMYLGLGKVIKIDTLHDVLYQLKDPLGNIILGPAVVPKSGPGYISNYLEAVAGPSVFAGGYNPIQYFPLLTGNYSLEFYYPPDQGSIYSLSSYIKFEYFDVTVINNANQPVTGRLWSKAWQFNCGPWSTPPTTNRFWGKMFILSDDSIVTSINCNGFVGGTFSISSNKTGCSSTGNIAIDRQSRTGFHTYPQYKIFLSDPDSTIFPTGKAQPGVSLPIITNSNCATGFVDFSIKVDQDGLLEIFIDVNPNPGIDPEDVKLTANVYINPGGTGYNIIQWNGKNGLGQPVNNGTTVNATVRFVHGITHLPLYDIEYNDNGYKVEVIRPHGASPSIYWDDSLIPIGSTVNFTGCNDPFGCHLWDAETGDTNTINSWWYVASATAPQVSFMVKRAPGALGLIGGEPGHCKGAVVRNYTIAPDPSVTTYSWTYSGTGTALSGSGQTITLGFSPDATEGTLSVFGSNAECGAGPPSNLQLTIFPIPSVSLDNFDTVCYNAASFLLYGGTPTGGAFFVEGTSQSSFIPIEETEGSHSVIYRYEDIHGCASSDTSVIVVKKSQECETVIWVPNAFTPNGDALNDIFKPLTRNIVEFSMNIYARTGELVFTSTRPDVGWDGTFRGNECPPGNYIYTIVYQLSPGLKQNKTLKGDLVLVR